MMSYFINDTYRWISGKAPTFHGEDQGSIPSNGWKGLLMYGKWHTKQKKVIFTNDSLQPNYYTLLQTRNMFSRINKFNKEWEKG